MNALSARARGRLCVLFVLGWVLRVLVALEYEERHPLAQRPVIDERSYESWALEVAGGDWLGHELFFQEPLYPYGLALVYAAAGPAEPDGSASARQRTAARHAQAFLGALCVAGVFLLTRRLFGTEAATIAGFAAATYRPLLLYPSLLLKPNLFLPLLCALCLLVVALPLAPPAGQRRARAAWLAAWLCAGLLAGAGALLRGNALVLLPVLVAWPLWGALCRASPWRAALAASAALVLGTSLVLLPVALRNLHVGGAFLLTTSGAGTNVYGGNNPHNPWGRATELPWVRGIPEHEAHDWRREAERRTGEPHDLAASSRFWLAETWRGAREQPGQALLGLWRKLRLSLGAYEVPDNHHLDWDARYVALLRFPFQGFALWGWVGLAGLLACTRAPGSTQARRGRARLAAVFLFYLATIVLTVTSARVRLALVVPLLPFAGALVARFLAALPALAGWRRRWLAADEDERPPERPGARTWAALALAALVVLVPALPAAERAEDLDERDFNLAVYLLEDGELDPAQAIAQRLAQVYPGTSRLETLLADLAYRRAIELRLSEASATREPREASATRERREALLNEALGRLRAVVRAPGVAPREVFRARALAGLVQLEAGDGAAAEGHLRAALAFDPDERGLRFALANALWMQAGDAGERARSEPQAPSGGALGRQAWLAEARELLEGLLSERFEPALAERLEEVRAAGVQ